LAKRTISGLKRVRQDLKKRRSNRTLKLRLRRTIKETKNLKEKAAFEEFLPKVQTKIDKAVKKGILHKNTAARLKSKLMTQKNKLSK
jgi:small subunit ribosomal protein S20